MFIVQISPEVHRTYINYPQVLELTLSQSHLPRENAVHFLQLNPLTQSYFLFHLVPITTGWTEAVDSKLAQGFLHVTSAAWIEPWSPRLWVQCLTTVPHAPLNHWIRMGMHGGMCRDINMIENGMGEYWQEYWQADCVFSEHRTKLSRTQLQREI